MNHRKGLGSFVLALALVAGGLACGDDSGDDTDVADVRDTRDARDEGTSCPTGQDLCGGTTCIDLTSAHDNCGTCGNACAANEICRASECLLDCPATGAYEDCGGEQCSSLMSDPANCGACGTACGSGEVCSCGLCVSACHDLNTDAQNCGECALECDPGQVCCCGGCALEAECPTDCPMVPIPDQEECGAANNACVDLRGDAFNCGACGTACSPSERCGGGVCTTEVCTGVEVYCSGRCTNLRNSSLNCGRCGNGCDPDREYCFEGECRLSG